MKNLTETIKDIEKNYENYEWEYTTPITQILNGIRVAFTTVSIIDDEGKRKKINLYGFSDNGKIYDAKYAYIGPIDDETLLAEFRDFENKWGLVKINGTVTVPAFTCSWMSEVNEGIAAVCRDGKYGYIDALTGEDVTEFVYMDAGPVLGKNRITKRTTYNVKDGISTRYSKGIVVRKPKGGYKIQWD